MSPLSPDAKVITSAIVVITVIIHRSETRRYLDGAVEKGPKWPASNLLEQNTQLFRHGGLRRPLPPLQTS